MPILSLLDSEECACVEQYLQPMHFPKDARIVKQGSPGHGCYLIEEGRVRLEIETSETDSDAVLGYLDPGMLLGEFSLLEDEPRSASAYAHTDVAARWLSTEDFRTLCQEHPKIGSTILIGLGQDLTHKIRTMNERVANYVTTEKVPRAIDELVARAVSAQKAFEDWPEDKVDSLLRDIADAIDASAETLAAATVQESGMGVVADKIQKIHFASRNVCEKLLARPGTGVLRTEVENKLVLVAKPMGVVLGLIPVTNPVPTMVFKSLICLKSRNALILSCHRKAAQVGDQACDIIQDALCRHGAPVDLIQTIPGPGSRTRTSMFMRHKDVSFILATGGPSMVRAAYSSGTPAIGVGAGNAPVLICADADLDAVAEKVISSKSFDNGVICGSENNLIVEQCVHDDFIDALKSHQAAVLDANEVARFTEHVIDPKTQRLNKDVVGQSAESILQQAGIKREGAIRLIIVPQNRSEVMGPFGAEKLAPILSLFTFEDEAEGFSICGQILHREGSGHTVIIHTNDEERARRFGIAMPASRILVNCPGSQGCIGMVNGLTPSLTLGCGTYGGTSTTDNVSYGHLLNIKRIAQLL